MAYRTFNGRTNSENGWPYVDEGSCQWITVPGTNVSLQIQVGQPLAIMRAFAADFNAFIERLRDPDSACWTPGNSVATSNHPGGTAMDLDWELHKFQVRGTFNAAQMVTLRELLDFYEDTIFWGGDWDSPIDEMHFQMGYNTYQNPRTADFIARKIRADGYSTFRRGNEPLTDDAALTLSLATGLSLDRARQILPTMQQGLKLAECTSPNRIAMFYAQTGVESASFNATEEYASGAEYEGRADLGNTQPGDGVRFKGRTWIQITGRHNYGEFSQWAFDNGLVPTPTYFVDHPTELSDLKWAGIGAAWYWTVARPDINAFSDQRDVYTVTRRINGGTNGLADRQARFTKAIAYGDQLLTILNGGDDLAAVPQDQWDRVYREETQKLPSRSALRHLGEGLVDTWAGISLNMDGNLHVVVVKTLAELGDPDALDLLGEVAGADSVKYPDRQRDALLARRILSNIKANHPDVLDAYVAEKKAA